MPDSVAAKQIATQNLARAYNAWQGSLFMGVFAAKLTPQLSDEQRQMRQQVLRVGSQLVETEFEEAMDQLVKAWQEYMEARNA